MKYFFLLIVITISFNIQLSYSQNRGLVLGDILWQVQVPDNPGTTFQDKQIKSLKQIPDVNNDGVNDVIAATGNYWTICYSGLDGSLLWKYSTHFGMINTGVVVWEDAVDIADLDTNGVYDVVIGCGGGNEMVYALNGNDGSVKWSYGDSTTTNDGDIEAVNIKYDFNGDGIKDVLISVSGTSMGGRHSAICLNALDGSVIFNKTQPQPFTDDIVATESGGAIGVNNNGSPYGVNGLSTNGSAVWNYGAPGSIWSLKEIPDINNDGGKDIIGLGGFSGAIFAITGDAGAEIWASTLGSSNNGKITLLDDANGNGFIDFILSAPQVAHRIDSKTGSVIWSKPLGSSYLRGVDNIGDINGDNIDEIVIATQSLPRLVVLEGLSGKILFDHNFGAGLNQRGDRAAVLDDLDTNGINEFLGGNREGKVICFYGGNGLISSIDPVPNVPSDFTLYQNYPNPFNPSTEISFDIPQNAFVTLKVFDILGRQTAELINSQLNAGTHKITFDAGSLSGGIYFYRLETEGLIVTKKMLLIK